MLDAPGDIDCHGSETMPENMHAVNPNWIFNPIFRIIYPYGMASRASSPRKSEKLPVARRDFREAAAGIAVAAEAADPYTRQTIFLPSQKIW
ncbi:hypothetical protein ACIU1J_02130 [Azospirillum doebereinerae]|uniref:hypothetical protein n=1 Tax=Azospirillum doebereinerae TaxID=92933 RepID=UPI001EE5C005|nr:hypothetical protein [Azospirillum doebereinerae]MCG5240450.1 hypothetical protein [Azospirillum doebereinerae]